MSLDLVLAGVALAGHVGLWAGLFNRLHATALPEWVIKLLSPVCHACLVFLAVEFAWWLARGGSWVAAEADQRGVTWVVRWAYLAICWGVVAGPLRRWAWHRVVDRRTTALVSSTTEIVDIPRVLGRRPIAGLETRLLSLAPWNDFLRLRVERKELALPRLPAELDGVTIAHLSDLHCCQRLTRPFFEEVVRQTNALSPDLIAITGDFFDHRDCLAWIDDPLAKLAAPSGVYYVLGNHDLYLGDVPQTRRRLTAAGMIDLGGRWQTITLRGRPVVLAGNELPWHAPAANMEDCPREIAGERPLRMLLSHAPDQLEWAKRWDFDLMLAGHTHGGQVRFPLLGPIFVPSRIEVRYSAGTFDEPPLVLHVSRGVSGKTPLRVNCPPELTLLTLRGLRVRG